jgi:hypothetical protein
MKIDVGINLVSGGVISGSGTGPMILQVDTENTNNGSTDAHSIKLIFQTGTYNCDIDWGDGSSSTITTGATITHDYGVGNEGNYDIKINTNGGTFLGGIRSGGTSSDELKFIEIKQWGTDCTWTSMRQAFYNFSNMEITATDEPTTSGLTTMYRAFRGCSSITNVPLFDVSLVTNWEQIFYDCSSLLSIPDYVSSPTNLSDFAQGCSVLTKLPAASGFDTSACTKFLKFTRLCSMLTTMPAYDFSAGTTFQSAFNACLLLTTFEGAVTLKTSGSIDVYAMFDSCQSLVNIPVTSLPSGVTSLAQFVNGCSSVITLPAWDTSNITQFYYAFANSGLGNFDFSTFDFSALDDGRSCFLNVTLTTAIYDQLLIDLDTDNPNSSVTFHGGNSLYTKAPSAAATARASLVSKSWVISDGGPTA